MNLTCYTTEITLIKDILVSVAAITTATLAIFGYSKWKKEIKGKSEYSLAKDILSSVYKVKRGFSIVRNPMIMAYEYPEGILDDYGMVPREQDYEATAHVYEKRWEKFSDFFKELEEKVLDGSVEWGMDFEELIKPMRECRAELKVCIMNFLERKKNPLERELSNREKKNEEKSVLYEIGKESKNDLFTPQINDAVSGFEKRLRKYV